MSLVTRFAPSPTGSLHVGGVRTALYCLLFARKSRGTFLLRIEDTDQVRSTEEAAAGIQRDLVWCGLLWDEGPGKDGGHGPYFQSRRLELYDRYVDQLLASGHAYEAWESGGELDAERSAAQAKKETFRYKHRPYTAEQIAAYRAEGRVPVVRLRAPRHDVTVHDLILGDVTIVAGDLEDIVIRKADGFPTYHFAVVIDDHHMGVTHILRGQEHLLNTPKHMGIYEALGWEPPVHGHLPLINSPQGAKMSKRDKAKAAREAARQAHQQRKAKDWGWLAQETGLEAADVAVFMAKDNDKVATAEAIARALRVELPMIEVMDFRKGGYLPEALVNYMALLGWSPGDDREILTFDEMVDSFAIDRVKHTAARFDPDKLRWMNGEYIKRASFERLSAVLDQYLEVVPSPLASASADQRRKLFSMYQPRVSTLAELDAVSRFFFVRPADYDAKALKKWLTPDGVAALRRAREGLASVAWTPEAVEKLLADVVAGDGSSGPAAVGGGNVGTVAQPLRVALTGTAVSPQIGETVTFFDRDEILARVDALLSRTSAID